MSVERDGLVEHVKAHLVGNDGLKLVLGVLCAVQLQQRLQRLVGYGVVLRQARRQHALALHTLEGQSCISHFQVRRCHEPQHLQNTNKY